MHPLDALLKEGVRNSLPNALEVSYPFDVPFRNTIKKAQHPYITLKTNQVIKMQLMEVPLASPLPTTAPHPRDVARKLLQARQGALATCGWVDGDFSNPITCDATDVCGHNTIFEAVFCCPSISFPYCGTLPTACVNSAYVAKSCNGFCPPDVATVSCTDPGRDQCIEKLFNFATLATYLTGYSCGPVAGVQTAYDHYTLDGGGVTTVPNIQSIISAPSSQSINHSGSSSTTTGPVSSPSTPSVGPVPAPVTSPTPIPASSSLSGGAIAGIAIGAFIAIAIIAGLITLLCIRSRKRQQVPPTTNQGQMIQTEPSHPPTSPPLTTAHTSFMSNPSATSATPLTQNNIAAMSQTPSEVRPQDSASNIGGHNGSMLSHNAPPTYHSSAGSQDQSGLGSLPGPQYPTGPAAFPNQNAPSVMSPGSAFGSMPPGVHAPSV